MSAELVFRRLMPFIFELLISPTNCCIINKHDTVVYPFPLYYCKYQTRFPNNVPNPEKIKTLYLWDDGNNLQVLKNGDLLSSKTTNLEALIFGKCNISEIEKGAFRGGNKTTQLSLAYNQIEELDLSVFADLPKLEKLWLHDNPLKSFLNNSQFPNLYLNLLHLAGCKIHSINPNLFENLYSLKELHLHGNPLTTIDWKAFRPLKNLQKVSLFENPFHCDCKIKFLLDYLDRKNISWNEWKPKPSCGSSAFDDYKDIESLAELSHQLVLADWDIINRQCLVCPPQVDSLQKIESLENHISLDCNYNGHPQPNVTWRINGKIFIIDENNKYLIQTKKAVGVDEPEYNYEFIQTFFISLLPYYTNSSAVQVTCQAFNLPIKSNESNAVSVKLLTLETTSVINEITSDILVEKNVSSKVQKPHDEYYPENRNFSTIILIIGAVTGFVLIIVVGAVVISLRSRKPVPFYHFLPQKTPRPPVEDDPTGHVYEDIRMSWIHPQDGDGYETPICLSIQHVPLPPLPQQQNPGDEANNSN